MRNVILTGVVLALVGCADRERVVASSPDSVMLEVDGIIGRPQAAMDLAVRECRRHGRERAVVAQVQRISPYQHWLVECR